MFGSQISLSYCIRKAQTKSSKNTWNAFNGNLQMLLDPLEGGAYVTRKTILKEREAQVLGDMLL